MRRKINNASSIPGDPHPSSPTNTYHTSENLTTTGNKWTLIQNCVNQHHLLFPVAHSPVRIDSHHSVKLEEPTVSCFDFAKISRLTSCGRLHNQECLSSAALPASVSRHGRTWRRQAHSCWSLSTEKRMLKAPALASGGFRVVG